MNKPTTTKGSKMSKQAKIEQFTDAKKCTRCGHLSNTVRVSKTGNWNCVSCFAGMHKDGTAPQHGAYVYTPNKYMS